MHEAAKMNKKKLQACVRNNFLHENFDARRCFALLVKILFVYGDSRMEPPVAYLVPVRNESNISGILAKMIQDENCALLGHYAGSNGSSLPTFRETDLSHLQGSGIQVTLEDGTDRLSQNFGKELPLLAA